eukprot:TRINITY_DN7196_c0_g1_i2.p1 TRINITY_DN7196_c0_g1~~TRINITY_DN7196_c0_g1_i2.p1  ORF type:complete len:192 (+),score=42.62 TRINITY_DN7196_c0_g1_i2:113-688(+)
MVRSALLALFAVPAVAYVAPGAGRAQHQSPGLENAVVRAKLEHTLEEPSVAGESSLLGAIGASLGVGAVAGWLSKRQNQAAAAAAAATLVATPMAASALVDYEGIEFLGGSDRVDINNAPVQAYRQYPGFYPTAAGKIASNGPYKSVEDIYNIPGVTEATKAIFKKYEKQLVCLPVSPAYFLDRINNGMYK